MDNSTLVVYRMFNDVAFLNVVHLHLHLDIETIFLNYTPLIDT